MDTLEDVDRILQITHSYDREKRSAARDLGLRFVHYTSPEAAIKMIRNEEVWLRKSTTMNDFSEIQHGLGCVDFALAHMQNRTRFQAALDHGHPGLFAEVDADFQKWRIDLVNQTYLTCISEHLDGDEDKYGRLSMWRAYGSVAVILNPAAFMGATDALATYSSPVRYRDKDGFLADFEAILQAMEHERDFLAARERQNVKLAVFQMLRYFGLCTKHPAFSEELEWRIFHSPNFQSSERMKRDIEIIRGVPQPVYKLPLKNAPDAGLHGLSVNDLVQKILIGPSLDAVVQAEAFVEELRLRGVGDPWQRVALTSIPLRQ